MRIQFHARVVSITEKKTRRHVGGVGADAVMEEVSLGWFLHLSGSYESLWVGDARPEGLQPDDDVRITVETFQ